MLNGVLGCCVPLAGGMMSEPKCSKLQQVKPDLRLLEADKGLEDVATNVFPTSSFKRRSLSRALPLGLVVGAGGGIVAILANECCS